MRAAPRVRDTRGFSHSPGSRLSIDPNHHVTEAIGDMYGDYDAEDRGSRYSFVSSAPGGGGNGDASRVTKRQSTLSVPGIHGRSVGGGSSGGLGGAGGEVVPSSSQGSPAAPPSSVRSASPSPGEAVYPLNDIDYESDPVAVAQEISNLQALRRMSMDVSSAADPDLPSFNSFVPSTPPDDGDPGSIFWVPARLHPELAPQEFSAFLEAKKNEIRRPQSAGGGGGSLSPDGTHSGGPSLRRKKSMLSRQIDADSAKNYRDGADRLEKRKSLLTDGNAVPSIQLDDLMKDPTALMHRLSADSRRRSEEGDQVDDPIIFAPKVGLKRSTATHYRRGSTRRERAGSKRGEKIADTDPEDYGPDAPRGYRLDRASTEPVTLRPASRDADESRQWQSRKSPPDSTNLSTSFDDAPKAMPSGTALSTSGAAQEKHKSAPAKARRSSSPRATTRATRTSEPVPPVPKIVETPPPPPTPPIIELPERHSSFEPPNSSGSQKHRPPITNRLSDSVIETTPPAAKPEHIVVPEAKGDKRDKKRPESSGSSSTGKDRKTSWGWLLGDSERAKEKEEAKEREREEKLKARKDKRPKSADKSSEKYDNTRLDVLQKSIELGNTGKVIAVDPAVPTTTLIAEPPSRTDSRESRKQRGEDKKEKEKDSGFLSFFGGSKKKSGSDHHHSSDHKKGGGGGRSRGTSPDPASEPQPKFYYTRFPIHIERAIYRLSHLKLANPRRPLQQQVLLSNFMYSYLALVQQTQPHLIQQQQTSTSQQQKQQAAEQQRLQEQQRWQQRQEEEARLQQQQRQHQDDGARDSDGYVDDSQGYDEYSDDETQASGNRGDYHKSDQDGGNGNTYYDQQQQRRYDKQQQQQQQQQEDRDDMW